MLWVYDLRVFFEIHTPSYGYKAVQLHGGPIISYGPFDTEKESTRG